MNVFSSIIKNTTRPRPRIIILRYYVWPETEFFSIFPKICIVRTVSIIAYTVMVSLYFHYTDIESVHIVHVNSNTYLHVA